MGSPARVVGGRLDARPRARRVRRHLRRVAHRRAVGRVGPGWPIGRLVLAAAWVALFELRIEGAAMLVSSMAVVWLADVGAYFAGRTFGRRRLAPRVSPGKTWEGVAGGMLAVLVVA